MQFCHKYDSYHRTAYRKLPTKVFKTRLYIVHSISPVPSDYYLIRNQCPVDRSVTAELSDDVSGADGSIGGSPVISLQPLSV